jgi:hypothetical protein
MQDTKPAFEIRNNSGSAFINKNKTEDWHAKYSGKCKINEQLYYFTVNPKLSAGGMEYMEFKLGKPVEGAPAAKPTLTSDPDF